MAISNLSLQKKKENEILKKKVENVGNIYDCVYII
jgi:hypothetical protein